MSKHTQGPWAVHYHESTDTYTIYVAGRSWECWAVAYVGDCIQDEDNARLIAAAPEMLKALKSLIALHDHTDPEGLFRGLEDIRARAAIAKAEGTE